MVVLHFWDANFFSPKMKAIEANGTQRVLCNSHQAVCQAGGGWEVMHGWRRS